MSQYTDEDLKVIIDKYEKSKKYRADYYRNKYQTDEVFREKHKEKSRTNYQRRKGILKENYQKQKELKQYLSNYNYHKNNNKVEEFINKYPELHEKYKNHLTD